VLIGPTAEAMEVMGSKIASKQAVEKFGVPLVPGINEAIVDANAALQVAISIGFPVLVKASAGGGGKGMRVVEQESEFLSALQMAQNEARNAFGDDSVFIEKYVGSPRHIELQIMADQHGNVCHLFERECSIQRRHQKLVEEAPSAALTEEIREKMGQAAVNVARACDYTGAGTVEFLFDGKDFYVLEMNTRLQVEHPVTEQIVNLDLVKEQIRVARGEALGYTQEDLKITGHAIELRVCAEDPANNFLPDIGKLNTYKTPQGYGVRVDDSFEAGMEIPIQYDPMIAKLITFGKDREEAMNRMVRAIDDYQLTGIETTLPFGKFVMQHEAFKTGKFDTKFIENYFKPEYLKQPNNYDEAYAFAAGELFFTNDAASKQQAVEGKTSNWLQNRKA
jgi:acetyl/propionyl-CoA carboxylase alpha subunit